MSFRAFLVFLCCLLHMSASALAQDVRLDKLSDCHTLALVQSTLQRPVSRSCRAPRNQLEDRLMSRLGTTPRLSACLLLTPPTARLAGFSCIDVGFEGTRELICFQPIDDLALRRYHANYDPAQTYSYKQAAAGCVGTNRDASEAPNTLFPQLLSPIAKADFGFVVGLGESRTPLTLAYHGFGSIDPDLALSSSALEVFDMTQSEPGQANQAQADSTDSVGDWNFEIYDMPRESQRDFAGPFERASGERISVRMRLITISTIHSSNTPLEDHKSDLENWLKEIADYLKGEGFRSLTPEELARTPFHNTDAMRDFLVKNSPFGNRDFFRRMLGPHLVFLVNEEDEDCNKVAEAFVAEPEEGVKNDRGGAGLMAFTMGRCRTDGGPDEVLDQMIQQETEILENEVRRP